MLAMGSVYHLLPIAKKILCSIVEFGDNLQESL